MYSECWDEITLLNSTTIYNVFVDKNMWMTNDILRTRIVSYLSNLPGSIGQDDSMLLVGSLIMCRRNDKDFVNGQSGFLLHYTEEYDTGAKVIYPTDIVLTEKKNKIRLVDDLEHFTPHILVYDFEKNIVSKVKAAAIKLCTLCPKAECDHSVESVLKVFFWHPNYAITTHNLQGVTLLNEELYLETDHILTNNILRVAYTILSRAVDPKQLFIDDRFVSKLISKIFPHIKPPPAAAIKRVKLF